MVKVIVAGGVSYNLMVYLKELPEPRSATVFSQAYHETVGGTGAGKALALHRLGSQVTLHALLGTDVQGQAVRDYFAQENLECLFEHDPRGTERHLNLMAGEKERLSIYLESGSFEPIINLERLRQVLAGCDVVVLNILNYCRQILPLAREYRKPIWCDLHNYDGVNPYHQEFLENADYLFLSSDALPDYRAFMKAQIVCGKKLVVCTHGNAGATALTPQGEWYEIPALAGYSVMDTNGAGDSFFAGVLYGHAHGCTLLTCLQLGALLGALSVTSRELVPSSLSLAYVEEEYFKRYGAFPDFCSPRNHPW